MSHQLPATVPSMRWSQRRHLLCLRIDVPNAFDIQTMIEEGDDEKPAVVISCYGTPPPTTRSSTSTSPKTIDIDGSSIITTSRHRAEEDVNTNDEPTAFYQFKFQPYGPLASDALDTCRAPTTTTDAYFRIHFPKQVQTNWVNFGVIIPASGATSDNDDDEVEQGGSTVTTRAVSNTSTRVVYDWDYCEGYLRNRYDGGNNKMGNRRAFEEDDGIADPEEDREYKKVAQDKAPNKGPLSVNSTEVLKPSPIRHTSDPSPVIVSADITATSAEGDTVQQSTTTPITNSTDVNITDIVSPANDAVQVSASDAALTTHDKKDLQDDDDDTSSNVSSLDSAEIEEDFANGLMEQMAEEQGMALTPEFYQSYLTKRVESKKKRKQDKIMSNLLSGKECECDQRAVLKRVTEFAKEMEEKGLLDEGGGEDESLRENSRVYNEILIANEKTAKGRAALTALVEQQRQRAASAAASDAAFKEEHVTSTQKDPETVEEALALLFPISRWSRMIKKNGIVKSIQYTTRTVVTFIANVVRWALGLGPVVEEVSLLDDVVVQCLLWSGIAIILFGYFLTVE